MKKTIGILSLTFWIPLVLAIAFPNLEDGFYTIAGLMMMTFGTWGGILLLKE